MELFEMLDSCATNDLIFCRTVIEDESSIKPLKYNKQLKHNPCLNQGVYVVSVPNSNMDLPHYTRIDELREITSMDVLDVVYVDHQYVLDYERVHCM